MVNIRLLKEKAAELNPSELSPLEQAILVYLNQDDYKHLVNQLSSFSDAEAFEIFRQILSEDQLSAKYFVNDKELVLDSDKMSLFLIGRNVLVDLDEKTIKTLLDLEIDEVSLTLKIVDDKIMATSKNSVNFKKHFNQAIEKISSVLKDQPINWDKGSRIMAVAVLGLSLSACSKAVYREVGPNLTPETSPITEEPTYSDFIKVFSNHAEVGTNSELYNFVTIEKDMLLKLPVGLTSFSFKSRPVLPSLHVFVNGTYVCSYVASNREYVAHDTCFLELELSTGDHLMIKGIPSGGETVTLKAKSL